MAITKAAPRRANVRGHGIGNEVRMQGEGYCQCGCGQRTKLAHKTTTAKGRIKGQPLRFIHGHSGGFEAAPPKPRQLRLPSPPPIRYGKDNNRFNGGLSHTPDGRGLIVCRDGTLLLFSRGVMAAHIGRLLDSKEIVHHKNEDPTDDAIGNLQIVTRAAHMEIHRVALLAARKAKRHAA